MSTATCSTISRLRQCNYRSYISSCVRHQSHRPRQLAVRSRAENLDRQTGAAARVISDTRKFDRGLKRFLHEDLHWLDVPQRVTYKLVFKCLHGLAPPYLAEGCTCTGRRRYATPQAPLCHSRTTGFSSVQYEKLWPTGILVRRSSCLELTARTFATIYFNCLFQALTQDVFIRAESDLAFSALETSFCSMGYISLVTYYMYIFATCGPMPNVMAAFEYRWRPTPQRLAEPDAHSRVPCSNAAKTRKPLKLAGVPQTPEPISVVSGPKFTIL